ncbi:hypothetical protein H2201_008688 [Coniosporium apollinis]|uniref:Fungal-type protein kinase domain-containing protein n=1 Tax=Coniosporium apollinis TaxID=61459 RepID=A0ABQ9NFZ7_9PEZI|nr:hypothetical protein H2201_008688 [Coniosporium apollinis]
MVRLYTSQVESTAQHFWTDNAQGSRAQQDNQSLGANIDLIMSIISDEEYSYLSGNLQDAMVRPLAGHVDDFCRQNQNDPDVQKYLRMHRTLKHSQYQGLNATQRADLQDLFDFLASRILSENVDVVFTTGVKAVPTGMEGRSMSSTRLTFIKASSKGSDHEWDIRLGDVVVSSDKKKGGVVVYDFGKRLGRRRKKNMMMNRSGLFVHAATPRAAWNIPRHKELIEAVIADVSSALAQVFAERELYTTYGLIISLRSRRCALLSGPLAHLPNYSLPLDPSLFPGEVSNPAILPARITYFKPRGKKRKFTKVTGSPLAAKKNKKKKQKKHPEEPVEKAAPKKVMGTLFVA